LRGPTSKERGREGRGGRRGEGKGGEGRGGEGKERAMSSPLKFWRKFTPMNVERRQAAADQRPSQTT